MTDYIKKEDFNNGELKFQITSITGVEKFSLWDNQDKKFLREGDTVSIRGQELDVNKYIKLSVEDKKRFGRKISFTRTVIHDGIEKVYDAPKSVEDKIVALADTISKMKQNPMSFEYVVKKSGTGLDTSYDVVLGEELSVTPKAPVSPVIEFEEEEDVNQPLNELEQRVVDAIKKKYPNFKEFDSKTWVDLIVKKTNCSEARAQHIVEKNL